MAKDKIEPVKERIFDIDLSDEMQGSFLEYSYSVIYSRALPDARDGLKPVHRRIVYQMGEMGLKPDRGHVKSARVTGEVMGKLHPHGDSAIYDALVRMAQPFSLRVPLIDGHGNFGSLDDGPAAARYTEVRLSPAALLMNEGLGEDVVDFKPNYDAQLTEPEVLPAAFPNLLVNGASGIAVGMATNMPPHNMREVIAAAIHLLRNPKCTLDDLMEILPGPDFPNGGIIVEGEGIKEAYELGKGSFKTRARVSIESVSPRKLGLVVTELPYLVGPEKVIEKIKEGVNSKKLQGISDVVDLTDRTNGLKLVIELKTGFDPEVVLDLLYRYTPMEDSFGINNVALVDGQPKTLGLRDMLGVYLAHRIIVTRRRSENRLGKKQARLHLVEGMLLTIVSIDEVIKIIRSSEEVAEARSKLMKKFKLSEIQADYILELRLRRLTKFSKLELENEKKSLLKEISELEKILKSDKVLKDLVVSELEATATSYGDDRRTTFQSPEAISATPPSQKMLVDAQLSDSPTAVTLTATGRVFRSEDSSEPKIRKVGYQSWFKTTTRSDVAFVTSSGRMIRVHVGDIPLGEYTAAIPGVSASEFLGLSKKEVVLTALPVDDSSVVALGTKFGIVKRVAPDFPQKHEFECIKLRSGDEVIGAALATDADELIFVTADAQLLRFDAKLVRPQGRNGAGIAGMKTDAEVIFFGVLNPKLKNVVISAATSSQTLPGTDSAIKLSKISEFPKKGRATGGVRCQKFIRGQNQISFAYAGPDNFIAHESRGKAVSLELTPTKRDASGQQGPNITAIGMA
jgi:DNA gyrase subunit A